MVRPQARSMGPGLPLMLGTEQGKPKPSSQGRAEQIQLLSELRLGHWDPAPACSLGAHPARAMPLFFSFSSQYITKQVEVSLLK